jgi:hypothetical protein
LVLAAMVVASSACASPSGSSTSDELQTPAVSNSGQVDRSDLGDELGGCLEDDDEPGVIQEPRISVLDYAERSSLSLVLLDGSSLRSAVEHDVQMFNDDEWVGFLTVDLGAELLVGAIPDVLYVPRTRLSRVLDVVEDLDIVVTVNEYASSTGVLGVIELDDRIVFEGDCAEVDTDNVARFRAERVDLGSAREFMGTLFGGDPILRDAFGEWLRGSGPIAWSDREPMERVLHVGDTPAEVLDDLRTLWVSWTTGAGWDGLGAVGYCTFVPEFGWNDCMLADRALAEEDLSVFVDDQALEVWLLRDDLSLAEPIAFLGTIGSDVLDDVIDAEAQQLSLYLVEVDGLDDVLARQGRLVTATATSR